MAEPNKYTHFTTQRYYDPELNKYGVELTGWTDIAWNNKQEQERLSRIAQEWDRNHPWLAATRDWITSSKDYQALFGNQRVQNVRRAWLRNPEVMLSFVDGQNIAAVGLTAPYVITGAAPFLKPMASQIFTPKGVLASSASGTLGLTANQWMPWLLSNEGIATTGLVASTPLIYSTVTNSPSISLPSYRLSTESASTEDSSIDTESASTETNTTNSSSPNSDNDDEPKDNKKPSFRQRVGNWIAGSKNTGSTSTENTGSWTGRMLWETNKNNFGPLWRWRNAGRIGLGVSYPAREEIWPRVGSALKYMTVGPDAPSDNTNINGGNNESNNTGNSATSESKPDITVEINSNSTEKQLADSLLNIYQLSLSNFDF